jgi:translocation and assembly module TamB
MNAMPEPEPQIELRPEGQPRGRRVRRLSLFAVVWTILVVIVCVGMAVWYASTPSFENRVRRAVIVELEKSTGGRVELGRFGWHLTHLEFEADDLTIHGLEAAGQVPYAHIDRLFVRLQILSFFRTKIGINYLEGDHPVVHLIVYPDGSTNQPRPKRPSTSNSTGQVFNLAIGRTVLNNGVAILNEQQIPFNLAVNNLATQVDYVPTRDHYIGTIHAEDIVTQRGADTPVHSQLDASVEMGRNSANLVSLTLQSGPQGKSEKTVLRASGTLDNFAAPHWQFTMKGAIDALEIRALTGVPGLDGGTAQLEANGHGVNSQWRGVPHRHGACHGSYGGRCRACDAGPDRGDRDPRAPGNRRLGYGRNAHCQLGDGVNWGGRACAAWPTGSADCRATEGKHPHPAGGIHARLAARFGRSATIPASRI